MWIHVFRGGNRSAEEDGDGPPWDGFGSGMPTFIFWFPKPHEMGLLFGTLPEFIAEYLDKTQPDSMERFWFAFKQQVGFSSWPNIIQPLVENYANRSTYRGAPLYPQDREEMDPGMQYGQRTGEAARTIGEVLGYSPAKIENVVTGWGGGVGQYGLDIANLGVRGVRAVAGAEPIKERPPSGGRGAVGNVLGKIPGVRAFVGRVPTSERESAARVYRQFALAEQRRRSWMQKVKEGRTEEADAYRTEHLEAIQSVATREEAGRPGPLRMEYERLQAENRTRRVEAGLERPVPRSRRTPPRPPRPGRR